MAGGLSLLEPNLNVVAGAAIRLAWLFLPIIGEKGAWDGGVSLGFLGYFTYRLGRCIGEVSVSGNRLLGM